MIKRYCVYDIIMLNLALKHLVIRNSISEIWFLFKPHHSTAQLDAVLPLGHLLSQKSKEETPYLSYCILENSYLSDVKEDHLKKTRITLLFVMLHNQSIDIMCMAKWPETATWQPQLKRIMWREHYWCWKYFDKELHI